MCGLCGGPCAIGANIRDGHILSVEKLKDHPFLPGDICVRGAALKQFLYHPDRIEYPMKKVGDGNDAYFVRVSWDEAISDIAARLLKTRDESGAKSTIFYSGHPKWFRKTYAELSAAYGTPNFVSESSTCRSATAIGNQLVCGSPMLMPDIPGCDVYVIWTENQSGQQGYAQPLARIKAQGKKIIVVDPHKNGLTEIADLHLQLKPGTDGALALGIANIIISKGLENKDYIEKYTFGFEAYSDYVQNYPPDIVAGITGVPEEQIYMAADLFTTGKVALKCANCSFLQGINGVQNLRAVLLLLALTGNIGLKGGNRPAVMPPLKLDTFHHDLVQRPDIDQDISNGEFPVWNEACMEADYVLPACAPSERDQVISGKQNRLLFVEHLIDPKDKLPDVEIMLRLAHAMNLHGDFIDQPDYDAYLNYTMRRTGVTLEELKAAPEGISVKGNPPKPFDLSTDIHTPSGKIEFVSTLLEKYQDRTGYDPLPVFTDWREQMTDRRSDFPFDLVTGSRKPFYFHSRTYRLPWISNLEKHTSLSICGDDARRLGLKNGQMARLSTPKGSMNYHVMIDNGLKSGVVYVYHDDEKQNINRIIDKNYIDPISGFPGYRCYICRIDPLPRY